jgi:hypothetical protein
LLGIFFFVTLSTASTALADTTIYACVQKKNGVVKVVGPEEQCASNESPLQWNATKPFGIWVNQDGEKASTTHPDSTVFYTSPGSYAVQIPFDIIGRGVVCTVSPYDNGGPPINSCSIKGTGFACATSDSTTTCQTSVSVQCKDTTNNLADTSFHLICVD